MPHSDPNGSSMQEVNPGPPTSDASSSSLLTGPIVVAAADAATAVAAGDSDGAEVDVAKKMSRLRQEILRINRDASLNNQEKNREIQRLLNSSARTDCGSGQDEGGSESTQQQVSESNEPGAAAEADLCRVFHEGTTFGCRHYMRSVKIQAACCGKWVVCRFCHDENSDHSLVRQSTKFMMCMHCLTVQACGQVCINRECGKCVSRYYCDTCRLWDDDPSKSIYHCDACGICRIGRGLGIDYFHCDKCNVCMAIGLRNNHRCIERNLESDCPICGEFMFTSTTTVIFMPCGHCIHHRCYQEHVQTSFTCPTCSKSLVAMNEYYRRIDELLKTHIMPSEFTNQASIIFCNDCECKSIAKYHFVYHKCHHIAFKPDSAASIMPFPQRKKVGFFGEETVNSNSPSTPRTTQYATYRNEDTEEPPLSRRELAILRHINISVPAADVGEISESGSSSSSHGRPSLARFGAVPGARAHLGLGGGVVDVANVSLNSVMATQEFQIRQLRNIIQTSSAASDQIETAGQPQQDPQQQPQASESSQSGVNNGHDCLEPENEDDSVNVVFAPSTRQFGHGTLVLPQWPEEMQILTSLSRILQMGIEPEDCGIANPYDVRASATIRDAGKKVKGKFKICGSYNTRLISTFMRGEQEELDARRMLGAQQPQMPSDYEPLVASVMTSLARRKLSWLEAESRDASEDAE